MERWKDDGEKVTIKQGMKQWNKLFWEIKKRIDSKVKRENKMNKKLKLK